MRACMSTDVMENIGAISPLNPDISQRTLDDFWPIFNI